MELKQIFMPNINTNNTYSDFQNKLQPYKHFENPWFKDLFVEHYADIMVTLKSAIKDYIDDDLTCNDDSDMFPKKSYLTGEWYISSISINYIDCNMIQLSIQTHLLAKYNSLPADDYLGLEIHLLYDKKLNKFKFQGDIDSSSI